jgi:hypothetical protein
MPTASPTPTVVVTADPPPPNTPVATASPPTGSPELSGRILDEQGQPLANVVVYLYRRQGVSDPKNDHGGNAHDTATADALTDIDGRFIFAGLVADSYRIQPRLTGYAFDPPALVARPGDDVPLIQALPLDLHTDGCHESKRMDAVTSSDSRSRDLLQFGLDLMDQFQKDAAACLSMQRAKVFSQVLSRTSGALRATYAGILEKRYLFSGPLAVLLTTATMPCS